MHILKIGVNYQIAPLAIREQLAFSDDEKEAAMLTLAKSDAILENVILSTCNRTEIFAVVESIDQGERAIIEFCEIGLIFQKKNLSNISKWK